MLINNNGLDVVTPSKEEPPYSYAEWIRLAKSPESNDRCEALDNISDEASDDTVRDVVLELLRDPAPLVRVCAADAARLLQGMPEVVDALRLMIHQETDDLAIAFGYDSLGRLGDTPDIPLFVHGLETLTTPRVRLSVISSFCLLLRRIYLLDTYELFKTGNFDLCIPAVNIFENMIKDENKLENWVSDEIQVFLSENELSEVSKSVHKFMKILTCKVE